MRGLSSLLLFSKRASGDSFSVRSVTNVRVLGFGTVSVVPLGLAAGTMRRLVLHVVPDPDLFLSESLEEDLGHLSRRIPTHTLLLLSLLQPRWQGPLLTPGLLLAIVIMCRCPIMGYLLLLFLHPKVPITGGPSGLRHIPVADVPSPSLRLGALGTMLWQR